MKQYKFLNKHTWSHLKVLKTNLSMLENIWCDSSMNVFFYLPNLGGKAYIMQVDYETALGTTPLEIK